MRFASNQSYASCLRNPALVCEFIALRPMTSLDVYMQYRIASAQYCDSCVSRFPQANKTAQDCSIAAFVRPGKESAADE